MEDNSTVVAPTINEPTVVEPVVVTPPSQEPEVPKGIPYDQYHKLLNEKKALEKEVESLKTTTLPTDDEIMSDEGRLLKKQLDSVKSEMGELKQENAKKDVMIAHPELKDKWSEFEEFRSQEDNKGMNMRTAAKAFLIEKDMVEPKRVGLEKQTGGPRTPAPIGMTQEQIAELRNTNYKKYKELLMNDQIKMA